jgi:hypothetical protein
MRVDDKTVRDAFEEHFHRYVEGKDWDIGERVKMWEMARRAFGQSSLNNDFHDLYESLGKWQVFRRGVTHWPESETFNALVKCDTQLAKYRLSCICKDDLPAIWKLIESVQRIKENKSGRPSVVAVSKFLHFWNPRLFVIVDDGVVWKWVFGHQWLRKQVEQTREQTDPFLDTIGKHDDSVCDLPTYAAVLVWASQLVRENPCIVSEFGKYIGSKVKTPVPEEVAEYEAAAVEWFLLGLVELRPAGVTTEEYDVPPKKE